MFVACLSAAGIARNYREAMHVDGNVAQFSDGGSIPPTSTNIIGLSPSDRLGLAV